jgi:hypothetical protein
MNPFGSCTAGSRLAVTGLLWGRESVSIVVRLFVSADGFFDEFRELRFRLPGVRSGFVSSGFSLCQFLFGDSAFAFFLLGFFVFGHI